MITILILNLVLAAAVTTGVLSLLTWGIVSDHHHRTSARTRFARRPRTRPIRAAYAG
jgi:hypothetical protein